MRLGLVTSLNHPGGNATGVSFFAPLLEAKRFNLLREAVPKANKIGALFNPHNPASDEQLKQINDAARARAPQRKLSRYKDTRQSCLLRQRR